MAGDRFLVSARKYRPQTFSDLVGQQHVAETLRNAIRLDRLAHAYLFCGPRGVGKTSAARILAKAVNCLTPLEERPDQEPCGSCDSCLSLAAGRSLDVIEVDAASNNKVEDAHMLRETVRIPPQGSRKKVYIVDEVHMLSKAAFNALLKTLEEPPPYVQFLFATTEPQKVIPTILSRCQRFDFRRISNEDIVVRLSEIAKQEGVSADEASLRLIARKGDGALRDALSTFDQSVLLCGQSLDYVTIVEALGAVGADVFFEVVDLVLHQDRAGLLELVDRLVSKGRDLEEFLSGLTDHIRDLLIAVTTGDTKLIEADSQTRKRFKKQGGKCAEADLLRHLITVSEAQDQLKTSVKPRLRVELTLLKMASLASAADLDRVLRELDQIGNAERSSSDNDEQKSDAEQPKMRRVEPSRPTSEPRSSGGHSTGAVAHKTVSSPTPDPGPQAVFGKPALQRVPKTVAETEPAPKPAAAAETAPGPVSLEELERSWDRYVQEVAAERIHVGALLQHARPASVDRDHIGITVPDAFHDRLLGNEAEYLREKLSSTLGQSSLPRIRFEISNQPILDEAGEEVDSRERLRKLREENPIIRSLFDDFGGELIW